MDYLYNGVSLQNRRPSNMDSLLLKRGLINGSQALLAVVCDGVGSLADGMFASGTAARMLGGWFDGVGASGRVGLMMRDAVLEINSRVLAESRQRDFHTASTLSALLLAEGGYSIVHVGDSRIYCLERGELTILTKDDVSESGKLTACIGQDDSLCLQYYEGSAAGKTFMLCTDGLYRRMDVGYLAAKIAAWDRQTLMDPIESLPRYAMDCGEHDNISIALVKIDAKGDR